MPKRGRPETAKPDKEWAERKLAQLDRETEHYRSIGSAFAETTGALAEELRQALAERQWRADKPWEAWTQRQRHLGTTSSTINAQTYDVKDTQRLALLVALAEVWGLRRRKDRTDMALSMAALSCREAAVTWGNADFQPLDRALAEVDDLVENGLLDDGLERSRVGKRQAFEVMVVARATGVSIATLVRMLSGK